MKVEVRLFAYFRDGREKNSFLDLKEGATPREILGKFNINIDEVAILLINGMNKELDTPLKDNDVLALFPPVGGG